MLSSIVYWFMRNFLPTPTPPTPNKSGLSEIAMQCNLDDGHYMGKTKAVMNIGNILMKSFYFPRL